jgi:hypothetical protein
MEAYRRSKRFLARRINDSMKQAFSKRHVQRMPSLEWLFEINVSMGPRITMGSSYGGERFLIPLTGGTVLGPRLKGQVLAGGVDRQLLRSDGVLEMDAQFEIESDDGVVITMYDRVLHIANAKSKKIHAVSQPKIIAPSGKYEWLNNHLLVGSLQSAHMSKGNVCVQVYCLINPEAKQ